MRWIGWGSAQGQDDGMGRLTEAIIPPVVLAGLRRFRGATTLPERTRGGLNALDDRLEAYLDVATPGYYVELGANDGINQSNTLFLEREYGWRGLLIEPSLNRYLELIRNRGGASNAFACAACVDPDYGAEFVRMTYANLMTVSSSLETDLGDSAAHVELGLQFLRDDREAVVFGAVARTLQSLLDEHGAPEVIDLLSLDVEGAELAVLRGIDHTRTRFKHILVECRDIDRLLTYISPMGYEEQAKLSDHDYLFRDTAPQSAN
jgi:FkbM family methyltransferase